MLHEGHWKPAVMLVMGWVCVPLVGGSPTVSNHWSSSVRRCVCRQSMMVWVFRPEHQER